MGICESKIYKYSFICGYGTVQVHVYTYSLPESDGHCEHGGIGVTTFYFFSHRIPAFNAVRSMYLVPVPLHLAWQYSIWWPQIGHFCTTFPRNRGFEGFEKINHHQIGTPSCIKKVTKNKKIKNKKLKHGVYMHYFDYTSDYRIKFFYFTIHYYTTTCTQITFLAESLLF